MQLRAELLTALPKTQIACDLRDMVYAIAARLSTTGIPFTEYTEKLIGDEVMDGVVMAVSARAGSARCMAVMDFDGTPYYMHVSANMMDGRTQIRVFGTMLPEHTDDLDVIAAHVLREAKKESSWPRT